MLGLRLVLGLGFGLELVFSVRVRFRVRVSVIARPRDWFSVKVRFRPGAKARASFSVRLGPVLGLELRLG